MWHATPVEIGILAGATLRQNYNLETINMAWDEKLLTAMDDSKDMSILKIVFRFAPPVNYSFINDLQRKYPFLDDEYCRFLSITDGASLWMYEFFGSGSLEMPALEGLMQRWQPNVDKLRVFPFAEYPGGNCIAMRENGEVIQFDFRAESDTDCTVLAQSFGLFVGNVLMGEDFYSLFDIPATDLRDNEWTDYLKQKGWLSKSST
ncbi:MAG: hypothetical protein C0478_06715 [Planctomyces sp.]|nr:hypothetical protein [Planctomyces sp.]